MAAAPNGSSIFPLLLPTSPIVAEFVQDAYVQLLELIAAQAAPISSPAFTTPSLGVATATSINGLTITTSTGTLTIPNGVTLTGPAASGTVAVNSPAPVAAGATLTLTATQSNGVILLNTAAGSTVTLPAATGSGNKYRFIVTTTTTSGAHKILAASSSDFINGLAFGENAGTAKAFASAAATNHSIQMPFTGSQPSGGFIGDVFDVTDVAANLWNVNGLYQAGTTPTTPFSAATS